jgi:hypothetical protein
MAPEFSNLIHGFLSPCLQKNMLAPELFLVLSTPGFCKTLEEYIILHIL